MNGGTPYLVPWPAMHLPLPAHLSKLTGLPHMQPQQFTLPQFTHFTLPGGQVYPINQMTLPPTLFTQNMVTHLPKIIMPPTVTFISLLKLFFYFDLLKAFGALISCTLNTEQVIEYFLKYSEFQNKNTL